MKMPSDVGPIHFVGIGGIGMSGIAEALQALGYTVKGSDMAESANVERLREKGIEVAIGHAAGNVGHAAVLVISSAVKGDNPEVVEARSRLLPVVRRAEMLGELMRLKQSIAVGGTHGKTTTTSMVAALLDAGALDPMVINGGIINSYKSNARLGSGDWMVAEADESDGTFVRLPADVAVVTNIDPEHMEHYGSFDAVKAAFEHFVENVPFYGFAVMCLDHPEVQSLIGRVKDRRIITYGTNKQADVRLENLEGKNGGTRFDVTITDRVTGAVTEIADLFLPMPGQHNALNAGAAIGVATRIGVSGDDVRKGLASFKGVKRRFTETGVWNGARLIDDYGHHPVEIAAVLQASRSASEGKVVAIVQPHRFSRLQGLFDEFCACFNDADRVFVAPVHPAGEAPIEGIDHEALAQGIRERGHRSSGTIDREGAAKTLAEVLEPGDIAVFLGAGSITEWANAMPGELDALRPSR